MKTNFYAALVTAMILATSSSQASAAERWHIKCFNARGQTLAIKALTADGVIYDVKAIEVENSNLLDVKVILPETSERMPIKVVASKDAGATYSDVKAIDKKNQILPIKAVTEAGKTLGVKAFYNETSGQYDIKCLGSGGRQLGLKAISPQGVVFDVKGFKDLLGQEALEVEIQAHIKARPRG